MEQKKQYIQNVILLLTDMIAVVCSYFLANGFWYKFIKKTDVTKINGIIDRFGIVLIAFAFVNIIFNKNSRFIKRKIYEEFLQGININVLFALSYAVMLFIGDMFDEESRGAYILTIVLNILIMFFFRMIIRYYLVKIYKNHKKISNYSYISFFFLTFAT